LPTLREVDGLMDLKMFRAIDRESVIMLSVQWRTLEHHTEMFMKTEEFVGFSSAMKSYSSKRPTCSMRTP
jgi:hypothetical protein